ncbi:MAG: hypothetical protein GY806_22040 [Gammaproteobacteria bacterium]|nr:hypothetical protein [Gammaproteobacteria bacterium]
MKYSLLSILLILVMVTGCASGSRHSLGGSTTASPDWARLKNASHQAFRDPNVWGTLLAAAVLQINNYDEELSDRLREDTPLFGSTKAASDASYDFRDSTELAYMTTALLTPALSQRENGFQARPDCSGQSGSQLNWGNLRRGK